jgi:predicted DNA-binding protein (UPF0251 family)
MRAGERIVFEYRRGQVKAALENWHKLQDGRRPNFDPGRTGNQAEAEAVHMDVAVALDALPAALRETVIMYYIKGFSQDYVASRMHVTQKTVSNRLGNALDVMTTFLNTAQKRVELGNEILMQCRRCKWLGSIEGDFNVDHRQFTPYECGDLVLIDGVHHHKCGGELALFWWQTPIVVM